MSKNPKAFNTGNPMPQPPRAKSAEKLTSERAGDVGDDATPPEAPRMVFQLSDLMARATEFFPDVPQARASLAGATHDMESGKELTLVQARNLIDGWRPSEIQPDEGA